ncbi:hypothetical protein PT974_03274 [Cladobotryum mycophilum]|uniref:C2H2-type domain-containing protein n=1 Tax=Cladobotryum mycophilum TaxID=491253 RepID=A0ABR0SRU3_9HYPO
MEPSSKKRKLAPKVNSSTTPDSRPTSQYSHETSQQHYSAHDAPVTERQDFEAFARHLQDAAMLIQRQTERLPYSDVSVLLLSWEEDQTVHEDLIAFEQVMQKQYNFNTQRWQIPTVPNPSIKLGVQMASFLENVRPNHLLIIYYAGYGYASSDGQLYWACNAREDAAKLKWDGVRCLFEDAQSDILLLLDTCADPETAVAGSHGIKQTIAACSPDHKLRDDPNQRSFTSCLTEALRKLSGGQPFSAQRLYEETRTQRQQHLAQSPAVSNNTASPPSPPMPILFTLTPGKAQNLTLASLPSRPSSSSQNGADADAQAGRARDDRLIDPESVADLRFEEARILVCTTFVGDASPDMSFFHQWLQNRPPLGARIAVEGISHNMIHLYEKLVGPAGIRPSAKEVEDGRILLEAREVAAVTPARTRREPDSRDSRDNPFPSSATRDGEYRPHSSPAGITFTPTPRGITTIKSKDDVEDSAAEMQEAAEQLKALSHVRHRSDEAQPAALPPAPASAPAAAAPPPPPPPPSDIGPSRETGEPRPLGPSTALDMRANIRVIKPPKRGLFKQETRCDYCSHAPFKDSSSLRKHVAAAHTRPFPCAFSFAGCASTFGSKNEWKRHIASQHLCLTYYRCSACPQASAEGKGNEFNRKDLFTQHLRRMHAPFQIKRTASKGDNKLQADWEAQVKDMQQSCLVQRRHPPQKSACPKKDCNGIFEGPTSWDEWTEHVGRHMEKGESQRLGVDSLLAQWALEEGIIEVKPDGEYRLTLNNGSLGGGSGSGGGSSLERKNSNMSSRAGNASPMAVETPPRDLRPDSDEMDVGE